MDEVAIPDKVREEVYKFYPDAKVAQLKTGGNFPYISRADEVNMHIQVTVPLFALPKDFIQVHLRAQGVFPNKTLAMSFDQTEQESDAANQSNKDTKQEEEHEDKQQTQPASDQWKLFAADHSVDLLLLNTVILIEL